MSWITACVDIVDSTGARILTPNVNGAYQPFRLKMPYGTIANCTDRGDGTSEVSISQFGDLSFSASYTTEMGTLEVPGINNLRAGTNVTFQFPTTGMCRIDSGVTVNSTACASVATGAEFPVSIAAGVATLDPSNLIQVPRLRFKETLDLELTDDSASTTRIFTNSTLAGLGMTANHSYALLVSSRVTLSDGDGAWGFVDVVAPVTVVVNDGGGMAISTVTSEQSVSYSGRAALELASAEIYATGSYFFNLRTSRPPGVACTVLRHDTAILELQEIA